jgi:phosphoribosylamine--glycine ligase
MDDFLVERKFGGASDTVLVEEKLSGREASVFAFTDGAHIRVLGSACDYKRASDSDLGPNTGGMGAYSPAALSTQAMQQLVDSMVRPTVDRLRERGTPYAGCIYLGLMLTDEGPKLLEYNARLGDPEAQVLLPLLTEDPLELFRQAACGELMDGEVGRSENSAVGVVMASHEYPQPSQNDLIVKTTPSSRADVLVFHGSTKMAEDGTMISKGGRVATVVGVAGTVDAARELAYAHTDLVQFLGKRFRSDIAKATVEVA